MEYDYDVYEELELLAVTEDQDTQQGLLDEALEGMRIITL